MLRKLLLFTLCYSFAGTALAQTGEQEAKLKAVFLYNFTRYVDWDIYAGENDFVIGILGPSDITAPLQEIARTSTVNNKRIIIRVFSKPDEITYCHMLFVPQANPYPLTEVLGKLPKGVLTVSEVEGLAKQGTAFNFVLRHDKLRFEANLKAIDSAGLKAGSQLLKLAIIIDN
jgi:hypothetical protein